jgi:hypothetical protein
VSRSFATSRMVMTVALIDHHLREAGLEHWARFAPSGDETGDDRIDIVEIEGGVPVSTRLRGSRFGVRRYHHDDDGEVVVTDYLGWCDTPGEAAARVIEVLRRAWDERSEGMPRERAVARRGGGGIECAAMSRRGLVELRNPRLGAARVDLRRSRAISARPAPTAPNATGVDKAPAMGKESESTPGGAPI